MRPQRLRHVSWTEKSPVTTCWAARSAVILLLAVIFRSEKRFPPAEPVIVLAVWRVMPNGWPLLLVVILPSDIVPTAPAVMLAAAKVLRMVRAVSLLVIAQVPPAMEPARNEPRVVRSR